uniref:Uncharacterized protein n=1 Tax=viral metagenome TaxID=1070528 RepID=A0A6C0HEK0_9ZZZZ
MAKPMNIIIPGSCLFVGILIGFIVYQLFFLSNKKEGFYASANICNSCRKPTPCGCKIVRLCKSCNKSTPCGCSKAKNNTVYSNSPDMSSYVLKSTIPPCPPQPDLSKYMLKTECPPVPNLENYILKSSVPKPQPVILDCSKCTKPSGECPPCPRPRCPETRCPPPTRCPAPSPCPRQVCPPTVVKCKSEEAPIQQVRPYLAPLSVTGFGLG